jgi:hypothetical protein
MERLKKRLVNRQKNAGIS